MNIRRASWKDIIYRYSEFHKDDGIVPSRAAIIIRKLMFDKEEIFNGDLSRGKQKILSNHHCFI